MICYPTLDRRKLEFSDDDLLPENCAENACQTYASVGRLRRCLEEMLTAATLANAIRLVASARDSMQPVAVVRLDEILDRLKDPGAGRPHELADIAGGDELPVGGHSRPVRA
jgi:hypothetical protein